MKLLSKNIRHLNNALSTLVLLILPALLSAQIPQNIEVEGEPAHGWQYLLWVLVLLFIIAAIFLILRTVNRRNERGEDGID